MGYALLDHATDVLVDVWADDMSGALTDAAYATIDIMISRKQVSAIQTRHVCAESDTEHEMLYNWLEEIIFQTVTEGFAVHTVKAAYLCESGRHMVNGELTGEPLDIRRHKFGVEIKSPTYHEMNIRRGDGIRMRFLMDL